jgi:SAM-dependent methyltransferase
MMLGMASRDDVGAIGAQVGESWLTTLEVNAEFDRPWVEAAVAWVLADGDATTGPIIDVGCGAGGAACAFARRLTARRGVVEGLSDAAGDRLLDSRTSGVVALDRDPRLIAVARARADKQGIAERVRWACGEVGRLPISAGSAGVVWASGVVHHVADQQAAIDELAELLSPGGRLALAEGGLPLRCLPHEVGVGRPGLEARLDEARARWFVDLRDELGGPPLPYGWPEALARAGLVDVQTRSFLAEATPPLDTVGKQIAGQHLMSALTELGDRLDADDRAAVTRLLDPDDPVGLAHRDDLVVTAVRTVHKATQPR